MEREKVERRLKTVLTEDEMDRLLINDYEADIEMTVDVHGLKCNQAKRFLNNIINLVQGSFRMIVIHGFNHGTAIRDMLIKGLDNPHIASQNIDAHNPGITHMVLI